MNMGLDLDFVRQAMLFSDSLVADRAAIKAKNEISILNLAMVRHAVSTQKVPASEITKARKDLGIS